MVVKVNGSRGVDAAASGSYRRPRARAARHQRRSHTGPADEYQSVPDAGSRSRRRLLADPLRRGRRRHHVNLGSLDKILEYGETTVRAQAGVTVGALARSLAERGQELPLTPEMGHMTLGAVAVTTLPRLYQTGTAQLSSLVKELKLITPQGKQMTVTEANSDLLRVLCSSFGLLGVVHEVVLRVQPLTPVKIDYQAFNLKEFGARFAKIVLSPGALRLHISPFSDQIVVERRTLDETASINRSGIWQIRQSVMRNVLPAFGSTVGSVLAPPGVAGAVVSGMQRALRATLDRAARPVTLHAHEWVREFPKEAWKSRYTYTLWAFPQAEFPKLLGEYNSPLQILLQGERISLQCRQRRKQASSRSQLAVQRQFRRPHVYLGAFVDGRQWLGRISDRFQRFCLRPGRSAHLH